MKLRHDRSCSPDPISLLQGTPISSNTQGALSGSPYFRLSRSTFFWSVKKKKKQNISTSEFGKSKFLIDQVPRPDSGVYLCVLRSGPSFGCFKGNLRTAAPHPRPSQRDLPRSGTSWPPEALKKAPFFFVSKPPRCRVQLLSTFSCGKSRDRGKNPL